MAAPITGEPTAHFSQVMQGEFAEAATRTVEEVSLSIIFGARNASRVSGRGCMERGRDLAHAVKHLPVKQPHVIALHYYQGMTLPAIAQRLRTSENTLKKRLQAALSTLRRVLTDPEGDETTFLPGPRYPGDC